VSGAAGDDRSVRKVRVGVGLSYLRPGHVGGSEVYIRELCRRLLDLDDVHLVLFGHPETCRAFESDAPYETVSLGGNQKYSLLVRLWHENFVMRRLVRKHRIDVLFFPGNYCAPFLLSRVPQVATVHDLQHLALPHLFGWRERAMRSLMFRMTFARSSKIIAISEFTRSDILARYRLRSDKVVAVLEGFDNRGAPPENVVLSVCKKHDIKRPYFIYPATDNEHKNHSVLLRAMAHNSHELCRHADLVFTGQKSKRWLSLEREADRLGVRDNVNHLGFVSRDDVWGLMGGATALAFPSLFEGFGLPLLEAMVCGTPVVASGEAAMAEVMGDAGVLASARDPKAWSEALQSLLPGGRPRVPLVQLGYRNLQRFSWEHCAQQTAAVLRRACR
jgi:glycosyltransferase involved in cell wall biosynthesis